MAINRESVEAARPDNQRPSEPYCELAVTGATVAYATPMARREVAAYLRGILPRLQGRFYEPHQSILGSLIIDLESFALMDADETVEPADIRDPATLLRERQALQSFRDWVATERPARAEAYHDHVSSLLDHP